MTRTIRSTLLTLMLLLLLATAPFPSYAQESTTIEGQITNGTAGAEIPQGLTITLDIYLQGQKVETRETVSDSQGGFVFEDVPAEEHGYVMSTTYSDATYYFEGDYPLDPQPTNLVVFETTDTSNTIDIKLNTLVVNVVDTEAKLMKISELLGVVNTGDRTLMTGISEDGTMNLLRFSLPSTIQDLKVQSTLWSGQIVEVEQGFALLTSVPPGSHEIVYTYLAPYVDGKLTFTHGFPFGTDTFRVLVLQELGSVTGTGMKKMENLVLGEQNYQQLEAHNLTAEDSITLEFTGMSESSLWERWQGAATGDDWWKGALPLGFSAALIALLAFVILRNKMQPQRATSGFPRTSRRERSLVESLARLDDRFQNGDIGEREYLQRRRDLKGQDQDMEARLPRSQERPQAVEHNAGGNTKPEDPEPRSNQP